MGLNEVGGISQDHDLAAQAKELSNVLGKFSDGVHDPASIQVLDNKIYYYGKPFELSTLDDELERYRDVYLKINGRVNEAARRLCPVLKRVFSPFNGGETTGLMSDSTIATDKLPIGTPNQVKALYKNKFARGIYLLDKLDRGHSYSGVTQELGYIGAMLQWDIEYLQKGAIQNVVYLDSDGKGMQNPELPASGIRIIYTTPDSHMRIHEQFTSESSNSINPVKIQIARGYFDGLYLRGTENLVTKQEFFPEYCAYVNAVRFRGIVVSDSAIEDLMWQMEGVFGKRRIVELNEGEQFGYAARDAKITCQTPGRSAKQGHVNILQKIF